ncbi:cytochrome P450 [Favolaschia claudopus]|uniref:Cytochrome P450 n=1 Tax=Favolaschia claudopus TaxID=2862362 RepID=A0AAW0ATN4_9AGAR
MVMPNPSFIWMFSLLAGTWLIFWVWRPGRTRTTRLQGPSSPNPLWGFMLYILTSPDISVDFERWATLYGGAFEIPLAFGTKEIVIMDPKALTHCYNSERAVYVRPENERRWIAEMLGCGVLWAEGETHKWQRKLLTPAFSNVAIRRLTHGFYDSSYKLKRFWDEALKLNADGEVIEVQEWMNRVALDSIGIAGFSHDFQFLDGKESSVANAFHALELSGSAFFDGCIFILALFFPLLFKIPTQRTLRFRELRRIMNEVAQRLLENTRRERERGIAEEHSDTSIIGLLIKAEQTDSALSMTRDELVAQNVMLLAGYETTAASLAWALIELAKHPEMQDKLRAEAVRFGGADPTWDQLTSTIELPYLDAFVHEVLRMHPALQNILRTASKDDVIPLGTPIVGPSGETISSILVAKGTTIRQPLQSLNCSDFLWGVDAKEFKPERWFGDITVPANQLQGHRHLLTFHDGPRTCLGKPFALAEMKAVLTVLIRNYTFEFPAGRETKIEDHLTFVIRPKVVGEKGTRVPLRLEPDQCFLEPGMTSNPTWPPDTQLDAVEALM